MPEEYIFDDYLLTNTAEELFLAMRPRFEENYGGVITEGDMRAVAGVQLDYLTTAIDTIHKHFGDMNGYLEDLWANRD